MIEQTARQRSRLDEFVFVCTNERDADYACCADVGSAAVLDGVKTWLRDRNAFWTSIAVIPTGCLGLCSEGGTAITIQPHDVWYSDVRPADVPIILEETFGSTADRVSVESIRTG